MRRRGRTLRGPGLTTAWPGPARRLGRAAVGGLALALALVIGARPAPLASGPRPYIGNGAGGIADRTSAPGPTVDPRFATLPFTDTFGNPGTWLVSDGSLPLQMAIEQDVADRYGLDTLSSALEVWNDTPGSSFALHSARVVDDGVHEKRRDGVNRVFLDERDCGERYLARAHLWPGEVEVRPGRSVAWVSEVDIGICARLGPNRLGSVLRHEVAHIAGLGHLCDAGSECWVPRMDLDNRCRVMDPAAYACQAPTRGDEDGFAYLHPVLPRIAGSDRLATVAAVSYLTYPSYRSANEVVLADVGAPAGLQAAAAELAALEDAPFLLVDADCTHGPEGDELNRVASIGATAVLVGAVADGCEDDLRVGWEFRTERLEDAAAVARRVVVDAGGGPHRLVLTARADPDSPGVTDAAMAVPAATRLGAPLLTTPGDELDGAVADLLADVPSITGVIVIGGTRAVGAEVVRAIEALGVRVRRIDATDRVEVGLKVSRMRDVFGSDPQRAVLVAADRPTDGIAAAALAATTGGAVIPVFAGPAAPDVRVSGYLAERVDGGYLVGGQDALPVDLAIRLNRAVDGAR